MPTTSEGHLLKVGLPCYLNTLPLLHYLTPSSSLKIHLLTPRQINQALERGDLDVGLASSLFYARNFQNFLILPDLSISAVGKVRSVILYHRLPLSELDKKPLGITPETETSFGLLRIVLEDFLEVFPKYQILKNRLSENPEEFSLEGYLAIGDEALLLQKRGLFSFSTDLAELWLEKTQLPFIFALFIVRKESAETKRILIEDFLKNLYFSRAKALSCLTHLVNSITLDLEKDFALNYLKHLEYDFSGLKQRAFLYFCELLLKKGLLPAKPDLHFFLL